MARRSRIDGLEGTLDLLGQGIPDAARDELLVEMGILGREILAAQHADAAKDTGALAGALTLRLLTDRLKVRIGLISGNAGGGGRKGRGGRGGPFYGLFVERGRAAQTVLVTRHIRKRSLRGNNRKGNRRRTLYQTATTRLRRRGPNKGTPIGSPYKLRVREMAPRPFVAQPILEAAAEMHLADYWSKVLSRTGAGG